MITQEEITKAIDEVKDKSELCWGAANKLEIDKRELETAKLRAISKGVEGKDAEERKANLEINLEPRKKEIETSQSYYNECKLNSEIANLELTRIKLTIRLMELVKK